MSILGTLFEICINVFQGCLYCYFLRKRLSLRPNLSRRLVTLADWSIILAVAFFYSLYIWFAVPVTDSVVWLFTLLYSLLLFSERWYIKVAWNIALGVLMLGIVNACSSLTLSLMHVSWEVLLKPSERRVAFVLTTNIVALVVIYIAAHLKPRQSGLSWIALLIYVLLNSALILSIEMLYNLTWLSGIPEQVVFIATFSQLFVAVCALVLFELLSHRAEVQIQLQRQIQTTQMTEAHYREIRALYAQLTEYQHDLKHQYALLEQMIVNNHVAKAQQYLEQLRQNILPVRYSTGNIAVDALLSVKILRIQQIGIHFECETCPLHDLPVEETAFCAMLGNLLDNAIEAVQRLPAGKWMIKLKIVQMRDMLCITCVNDADEKSIQRSGNTYLSSKERGRTGFGLESIHRIVEQADGVFTFKIETGKVIAEAIMPLRRGEYC